MLFRRSYKRYRQIFDVLVKYGFEDVAGALNVKQASYLRKRFEKPEYVRLAKLPAPVRVRMILEELGPTFIKFGQILSTRPDLIPMEYAEELKKLQDCVPKRAYSTIKDVIEEETGKEIHTIFPYFEENPIASASIGQVHIAKLKNGKKVIVKVQKPDIENVIEYDISILYDVANLIEGYMPEARQFGPKLLVSEFAKTIRREQNYRREARNATRFRQNFKGMDILYVPEVEWEYNSRKVLVLEYIEGKKFNDYLASKPTVASKKTIARRINNSYMKMILEDGFFHADPHPGNIIIQKDNVVCLVDFGMVGYIDRSLRSQIVSLLYALAKEDTEKTIASFIDIGVLSDDTNIRQFRSDFHEVLHEYYNTELKEVHVSEMFHDILEVVRAHKVRLPHNFLYLLKVIGEIESICQELDPGFNLTKNMGPFLRKLLKEQMEPKYLVKNIHEGLMSFNDFIWKTPKRFNNIFDKLEHGKLKLEFEHKGLEQTNRHLESASNKITFSIIIAAIIMGSSLLILRGGVIVSTIGIMGYLLAALLGFWLAITIIMSGKI
ncbi:MAG: AarF/ABC1/UbiB kinase family protein [Candidatus Nanohalarchaeota archaeon]|nr:MAG: AarF/ABC1/UbiB kinase family protein [Candidatus Nanohaloarchaeota archaeon]